MKINYLSYDLKQPNKPQKNGRNHTLLNTHCLSRTNMYFKSDIKSTQNNNDNFCNKISKIANSKIKATQLVSEKLSYSDVKQFEEIYKLDDNEFSYIVHYQDSDKFKDYLSVNSIVTFLVKDKKKKLLGYYQIYMPSKGNLYIETLNLKPKYRGKHTGFTTHVFDKIKKIAEQNKANKISLHVETNNETALALYKRLGFKIKSTRKGFYNSSTNPDAYYMEKDI